jgi:hypothetical protein
VAAWDSLADALNTSVLGAFGQEVTYTPQTGGPVTIRAVFEATREAEENAPGVYAVLFVCAGDLSQPPERGDEVTVDAVTYKVFGIEADTTGAVVLRLRQV